MYDNVMQCYTLNDFATIQKNMRSYSLPPETIQCIQLLCKNIGTELPFIMTSSKNTIHDSIREINKLTDENKIIQIPKIISILKENEHEISMVSCKIFKILISNSFFSKLYAELFSKLYHWKQFQELFDTHYHLYLQSFDTIETCDPIDYDLYCQYKKTNDNRRSFSLFLVHLIHYNLISTEYYLNTVNKVFECIDASLNLDKKDCMNEYIENLYLLAPNRHGIPIEKIKTLTLLKPSDYIGINYKFIFRCMDVLNAV